GIMPATMIAYMANAVLPLRAGEVVRVYVLARKLRESGRMTGAQSVWLVAATLVVERVLDSLAIVSILAMLVLVIPLPRVIEWAAGVLLAIDVVGVSVLVAIVRAPEAARPAARRPSRRWAAGSRTGGCLFCPS